MIEPKKILWIDAVGKTVTNVVEGADDLFVAFGDEYATVGYTSYPEGSFLNVDSDAVPNDWEMVQLGFMNEDEHDGDR